MIRIFLFLFFLGTTSIYSQRVEIDSIIRLRKLSSDDNISIKKRIKLGERAVLLSYEIKQDSSILKSSYLLSNLYLDIYDYKSFKLINYKNLKLAKKLQDSLSIANINELFGYVLAEESKLDSAFYYYNKAKKVFKLLGYKRKQGIALFSMANIQDSKKDYIGAEINAIAGVKLITKLPKNDTNSSYLWYLYNLLGIIFEKLEEYDESILYHNKALSMANEVKNDYFFKVSQSNIGSLFRRQGNYSKAIKVFGSLLKDKNLIKTDSASYAYITASFAHSKFLNKEKTSEIDKLYRKALNIYSDLNHKEGQTFTNNYFAEYFKANNEIDSALKYTNRTYKIAKEMNLNENILKSLMLKSALVKDSSHIYFQEHAKLSDSLQKAERAIRNKFARIEYETEEVKLENLEVKQENLQISRQRLWLLLVTGILAITLFLLYIIKTQREKNKELELAQKQQEFNEEIYNLMLSQQEKIDHGRAQEKKQISQELHDGVLGRLFGVRLSLDSLNFSKTDEAIKTRGNYIEELQAIEQDIRKVSHELNTDFVTNSGYFDIVKALVEKQTTAYNLEHSLKENNDINWESLTNKVKMHCYRIIQESLQNIYKHAKGSRVDISFEQIEDQLKLIIKDDGAGFDLEKAKKGIGLKNMRARVKEIQGELNINTKLNKGTTLTMQIPN